MQSGNPGFGIRILVPASHSDEIEEKRAPEVPAVRIT